MTSILDKTQESAKFFSQSFILMNVMTGNTYQDFLANINSSLRLWGWLYICQHFGEYKAVQQTLPDCHFFLSDSSPWVEKCHTVECQWIHMVPNSLSHWITWNCYQQKWNTPQFQTFIFNQRPTGHKEAACTYTDRDLQWKQQLIRQYHKCNHCCGIFL